MANHEPTRPPQGGDEMLCSGTIGMPPGHRSSRWDPRLSTRRAAMRAAEAGMCVEKRRDYLGERLGAERQVARLDGGEKALELLKELFWPSARRRCQASSRAEEAPCDRTPLKLGITTTSATPNPMASTEEHEERSARALQPARRPRSEEVGEGLPEARHQPKAHALGVVFVSRELPPEQAILERGAQADPGDDGARREEGSP